MADASARGGVGPTNCYIMYRLRDNLVIKVDVADSQLRFDKECSFRVYLHNTMAHPFWNVKLEVCTDQFETTVVPSSRWKTYPDLQSAATGGTREYFTVNLNRKPGIPDGQYDLSLRVFTTRFEAPKLNAIITVAEALDQHKIPFRYGLKMDGQLRPQDWGATPALKDFSSFTKNAAGEFLFCKPKDQTRVHVAADHDNIYLLLTCMGRYDRSVKGNEVRIYTASEIDSKPQVFTLDESIGQIIPQEDIPGLRCVRCPDDSEAPGSAAFYQVQLPRRSLGLTKNHFYLNFCRAVADRVPAREPNKKLIPENSYWRGNEVSVQDPVVYGRMVINDSK
jgi:hypothetical protein